MIENPTIGDLPALLDIIIRQGDSKEIVLAFKDNANNPVDLSGYSIKMDVKQSENVNDSAIITKSIGNGLSIDVHVLTIHFAEETLNLNAEKYFYDILFSTGSKNLRWIAGKIIIDKSVTK